MRTVVVALVAAGLGCAIAAEVLVRAAGFPGAAHLVGVGCLYLAWWIALTGALLRVGGTPFRWFTTLLPVIAGVLLLASEVAIASGRDGAGELLSTIAVLLVVGIPVVTPLGARAKGRAWKSGLVAWSLLLYQALVSVAAFTGLALGTFGDESRADELAFGALFPPLLALSVAGLLGPGLPPASRIAAAVSALLAVPAIVFTTSDGGTSLLVAIAACGALIVTTDSIGRAHLAGTSERPSLTEPRNPLPRGSGPR